MSPKKYLGFRQLSQLSFSTTFLNGNRLNFSYPTFVPPEGTYARKLRKKPTSTEVTRVVSLDTPSSPQRGCGLAVLFRYRRPRLFLFPPPSSSFAEGRRFWLLLLPLPPPSPSSSSDPPPPLKQSFVPNRLKNFFFPLLDPVGNPSVYLARGGTSAVTPPTRKKTVAFIQSRPIDQLCTQQWYGNPHC